MTNGGSNTVRRRWLVCGLLLLASAINYMDRQTLANASVRVSREFGLAQEQYGNLEAWFAYAFAGGSLFFGFVADKVPLRWLYPVVLVLWSSVGFATGHTRSYEGLLWCRTFLGFFEGGHWPCGVKATRALLDPADRSLGNSVLQSGTSIGAILTPLIMRGLMTDQPGSWRLPFQVIGVVGLGWVILWFAMVRASDLVEAPDPEANGEGAPRTAPETATAPGLWSLIFSRRMLVVFLVIACINTSWQILRAWLPKFLQEGRGWGEAGALYYNSAWFAATDVGCLGAGALAVWLARRGWEVNRARATVFGLCAAITGLCVLIPWIRDPWMLGLLLMVIGAGALGMFPIYHTYTQDISGRHQGRITGIASVAAWVIPAQAQRLFGWMADRTGSFDLGLVAAGLLPLVAWLALRFAWGATSRPMTLSSFPIPRRSFIGTLAAGAFAAASRVQAATGPRKKIALLGTVVFKHSHAQHFIDRFAGGYGWQGEWRKSGVDLVSLYIDQFPATGDLARSRADRYRIPLYRSIREALCLGGNRLAVDGVVIIGEHGNYPKNEQGQTLYPRHAWFKEVVKVFEDSGRSVPVFNDKHLSTDWAQCAEMVEDAKRLKFPFLAGSSLPVTWRLPSIDVPFGAPLTESVCACYGGVDSYDFHGLETAQCMSERRRGGESGISSVHALKGAKVWETMDQRPLTRRLLVSALSRSHTLPVEEGFPTASVSYEWARQVFPDPIAYFIEHRDGFRTSMFLLPIRDFNYAGHRSDTDRVVACQMYLPMPGSSSTTADFFNPLVHHIEEMVIQGRAPYPVERTLLTSGMTLAAVESLHRGQAKVETPEMAVRYRSTKASTFWRD